MTANPDHKWSGVFCLEGAWEDALEDQSSVLPMLELLKRLGYIDFIYRDAGTSHELEHYLRAWVDQRLAYYTLYLAFHGSREGLFVSNDYDPLTLGKLGAILEDS